MAFFTERANDSLDINPPVGFNHLSTHGSNWLWAVTALFGLTFLTWLVWTFVLKAPGQGATSTSATSETLYGPERTFHYLWTIAAFAGLIAYFTMASDLGNTAVHAHLHNGEFHNETRQIFYARYVYWFVAWPMVITAVLLLSGVSWATILFAVVMQEFWVLSWLFGSLVSTTYKWGYFVIGVVAYYVVAAILLHWGRSHSRRLSAKHYTPLTGLLVCVWALYIIAWAVSEGSNLIKVTSEMIFYGILDLISVPLLGFAFLYLSRKWDHGAISIHYTQRGRVYGHDPIAHEKTSTAPVTEGVKEEPAATA